jgi:hypothetical protein
MKDIMEGISPLPFVADNSGETIKIRLSCGAAICDMKFMTSIPIITKLPAAQNAAYIVYACNLYPELVEILKLCQDSLHYAYCCVDQDQPEEGCSEECKKIRAILAKCKAGAERTQQIKPAR